MKTSVDIDVNAETGVWTTDGLPMLYVPRHFMLNVHDSLEGALGLAPYSAVLHQAGSKSAYFWCKQQAESLGIDGIQAFSHYLDRLSARGWGQFRFEETIFVRGSATVTLRNSIYVLGRSSSAERPVCYMFEGFLSGGMTYLAEQQGWKSGSFECRETQCQALGHEHCVFEIHAKE
ncbi:DUF5943 domain-containing protein [Methylobacterium sp. P31]